VRAACRTLNCGQRQHLNRDLQIVTLGSALVAALPMAGRIAFLSLQDPKANAPRHFRVVRVGARHHRDHLFGAHPTGDLATGSG
jgi:hypothetical protein